MELPKEVVIPRNRLRICLYGPNGTPMDAQRCAIGWLAATVSPWAISAFVHRLCVSEHLQWQNIVERANDRLRGEGRERRLTKLFARKGIALRFVDTIDESDPISDEFNTVADAAAAEDEAAKVRILTTAIKEGTLFETLVTMERP